MRHTTILIAAVATLCGAPPLAADPCQDRCQASYQSCAAVEAAGCELGSDLVGAAASDLAEQAIPGFGALFGGFAKQVSKETCQQQLVPCEQIRDTCLAECTSHAPAPAPGSAAAPTAPPPPPVQYATFRVFSDHPRTIVYINGQRMGATPEDPLEPFVTPELRVGKYWVRMVTADGRWEWEGAKDVEEGNINAVEGRLVNLENRDWYAAQELDRQGAVVAALEAYDGFIKTYPDSELIPIAHERIAELSEQLAAAERELYAKIEGAADPHERLRLCEAYLAGFVRSERLATVSQIADRTRAEIAQAEAEQASWGRITAATGPRVRLAEGEHYLATFAAGPHRPEVEQIVAAARVEVADLEARRKPLMGAGIAALAVGAAAAIGGGAAGIGALVKDKQLDEECQSNGDCGTDQHAKVDERDKLAVAANVLLIGGGTLFVAGIVLVAIAPDDEEQPVAVQPLIGSDGAGASLQVRF